jgi:hypothetical protein
VARIRSIKPQAFTSESLASRSRDARWAFAGLWTYCDDDGYGKADPRLIKGALFPLDDDVTPSVVTEYLDELSREDDPLICRYEVDGRTYLHVISWEHQSIQKKTGSKLPRCPIHCSTEPPSDPYEGVPPDLQEPYGSATGGGTETYAGEQGTGSKEEGRRKEVPQPPAADAAADAPPKPSADKNDRDDVRALCDLMVELVVTNGSKRPRITKDWQDEARRLIDLDGRELVKALELMRWAAKDTFWRANIQSIPTFREKYDKLRLQALAAWEREQREAQGNVRPIKKPIDFAPPEIVTPPTRDPFAEALARKAGA